MYKLTPEGEKYLKGGLPEVNLLKVVRGPVSLGEARQKVENFSVAVQWALKRGWVKIEGETLIPLERNPVAQEQGYLQDVLDHQQLPAQALSLLLKRKLVEEVREDIVKQAERHIGKTIATLTPELIKTGLWRKVTLKPYDVTVTGRRMYGGRRHPYMAFLSEVRRTLAGLGFKEMTGPNIETEFWNFDALYQAQNHPSRDWTQTYRLKHPQRGELPDKTIVSRVKAAHEYGWKTGSTGWGYVWDPEKAACLMPRAHDTAISPRQLVQGVEIPGKYFSLVRCYRPDIIDATHAVEFYQMGGIVIDRHLTFRNLLGLLKEFASEIAGVEKVKFLPDYYPFTEYSCQLSALHPRMGWVELAGAGLFRPELTEPLGVNETVIAWGLGIDRLAMFKLGITDIRELFTRNLAWLREVVTV
jgi:phenylalanyl-tRNA synthetase alpha chain